MREGSYARVGKADAQTHLQAICRDEGESGPVAIAVPGSVYTVTMVLANGPSVGLPFVVVHGVPRAQQARYLEYFQAVWDDGRAVPASWDKPRIVRSPVCEAPPGRDRMGITLRPHPHGTALLHRSDTFQPLIQQWPQAPLCLLGLLPPPVDLGNCTRM